VLYGSLLVYEAFTTACIFAPDVTTLIVLRAIEGLLVGSTIASVQAIIADVFDPSERGAAMGAFLVKFFF
jgi:MFS family permease